MKKMKMLVPLIVMILISCQAPQKKIVIALASTPRSLNPLRYKELASLTILCNIYEPLVTEDEAYNIRPLLAKFWERKDETTWLFYIRKGVKFHNGKPLTAYDVAYSFYYPRLLDKSDFRGIEVFVDTIYASNDSVVVFKTKFPYEYLLVDLISYFIIPQGFNPDTGLPCGTGPYRVIASGENFVTVKRWGKYWGERPYIDEAKFIFVENLEERISKFINGEVDIIDYVPLQLSDTITKYGKLVYTPESSVRGITFNLKTYPFDQLEFRHAVSMAINREELINDYYKNLASSANQIFPPSIVEYMRNLPPLEYDTVKARKIFQKYNNQTPYLLYYGRAVKPLGDRIVSQLQEAGLNVKGNPLPSPEFWEKVKAKKFQFYLAAVVFESRIGFSHLLNYYHSQKEATSFGISNRSSYANSVVDSLVETAMRTADSRVRVQMVSKAVGIIMRDMPFCPITFERTYFGTKRNIEWTPSIDGRIYLSRIKRR